MLITVSFGAIIIEPESQIQNSIYYDSIYEDSYFRVGDYAYTIGGQFIGVVTAVGSATSITFGGGTKIALGASDRLLNGRLKHLSLIHI